MIVVIRCFRRSVNEGSVLQGYDALSLGKWLVRDVC